METANLTTLTSSVHTTPILVGWTPESPERGTLAILTSCMVTTAICTWGVIHPRIDQRKKFRSLHKLSLWLKTIVAPELIAAEAAYEWMQAQRTRKQCSELAGVQVSQEQAFYVGMFGLQYRTVHGTKILWPNQWGLELDTIKDKSNADSFAKLFALVQVGGFVLQCILRLVHALPLAPLEVMTLGYIPLFAVTYFYWWLKPKDIDTPSIIDLPGVTADQAVIFADLCVSEDFNHELSLRPESLWSVWSLTPRVFEKDFADQEFEQAEEDYEADLALYKASLTQDRKRFNRRSRLPPNPPQPRKDLVLGHWDPSLYHSKLWPFACLVGVSFPALHLISWDTMFPTIVELWLWRASAIISICGMLVFMQFERIVVRWQDPLMVVKILAPVSYLVTRVIMLTLAFAAFRAADPALYHTYVMSTCWTNVS